MTNASNTQWEVAGGKKNALKKVDLNGISNKLSNGKASTNKDYVSKIPKLSTQRNNLKLNRKKKKLSI